MRCARFFWILVGAARLVLCSSCDAVGTEPARLKRQGIRVKWPAAREGSGFVFSWDLFTCSLQVLELMLLRLGWTGGRLQPPGRRTLCWAGLMTVLVSISRLGWLSRTRLLNKLVLTSLLGWTGGRLRPPG